MSVEEWTPGWVHSPHPGVEGNGECRDFRGLFEMEASLLISKVLQCWNPDRNKMSPCQMHMVIMKKAYWEGWLSWCSFIYPRRESKSSVFSFLPEAELERDGCCWSLDKRKERPLRLFQVPFLKVKLLKSLCRQWGETENGLTVCPRDAGAAGSGCWSHWVGMLEPLGGASACLLPHKLVSRNEDMQSSNGIRELCKDLHL